MHTIIRSGDIAPNSNGTIRFEGENYGAPLSRFLVNNDPGRGARLHRHPYAETWIVRSGHARFTVGDEEIEAGAGDILVVGPNTPHKFINIGGGKLELTCIHASPNIIQEDLE